MSRADQTRPRRLERLLRPRAAAGVVCVVLLLGVGLFAPAPASAVDLFPVDDIVGDIVGGSLDFAGDQVAGAAVAALMGLIEFFVGPLENSLGKSIVHFLLGLPDYSNPAHVGLNRYADFTTAIGWGLLGLVFTGNACRFWASGYSSGGSYEAAESVGRCIGAGAALVVLPDAFHYAVVGVNKLTYALITGPGVGVDATKLFVNAFALTAVTGPFGGLAMLGSLLVALALVLYKIVLSATLAVLFIGAPLAIALSPLDETTWLTRTALQGLIAVLLWPVVWALCFAAFALLGEGAFGGGADNGLVGKAIQPLVALAALISAFKLPTILLGQAFVAGSMPGARAARMAASTVVVRQIRGGGAAAGAGAGAGAAGASGAGSAAGGVARTAGGAA